MLVASGHVSLTLLSFDCEWTQRERPEYSDLSGYRLQAWK